MCLAITPIAVTSSCANSLLLHDIAKSCNRETCSCASLTSKTARRRNIHRYVYTYIHRRTRSCLPVTCLPVIYRYIYIYIYLCVVNVCVMYGLCKCVCMQQGDMLAVSPYESHHDPRFFQPHPARYDPTRAALQCPGSSLHEVPGISGIAGLVFGGGRYRSALTLRHPRWPMQHHISRKREPTMQHCTTPL